ncbi:PQQ-like beta-propeller repeat protein [Pontivivens ytuae]|uniref:PQQ-like beta-propeller repeat protein n=1 Tax=Pontivivens ytuae TaxID=2789856 RepID=A0A7S9QCV0_9RHOB|nr:PQQ-like beta-propeller repeat protein [Pontivivens ytuae]QPH53737.1 PQQ-like beta-propeller repeat protein [Pontivivens ytuae]
MRPLLLLASAGVALSGCGIFSGEEPPLPGERIPVRPAAVEETVRGAPQPVALGAPQVNTRWTHEGGTPSHTIAHPALGAELARAFSSDVGAGSSGEVRLTSGPVVSADAIYTLDATAGVVATAPDGSRLWSRSLVPDGQPREDGFGGGVTLGQGVLFVTTGFGDIYALEASTGAIVWQQNVGAPFRAASVVSGRRVIAVSRNDVATAFDVETGAIAWRVSGARGTAGVLGGAQPTAFDGLAVLPFSSGEVLAVFDRNGRRAWANALGSGRRGLARASIADVTGDPVFSGTDVIAGNQSGSLVSIDARTGIRNWTQSEGAQDAVLAVGGALWFVSDRAELIRLDAESGGVVWRVQLPERNPRDRDLAARYTGPVLAGGRLFIANGHDGVLIFDPASGDELGRLDVSGGAAAAPAVANETLYVLSNDARLIAFR